MSEGRCTSGTIPADMQFPDFGVPEDSTFFGADYLGAEIEKLGVLVDQFHSRDEHGGDYHGSFAPLGSGTACVPVLESYVNREPQVPTDNRNVQFRYTV